MKSKLLSQLLVSILKRLDRLEDKMATEQEAVAALTQGVTDNKSAIDSAVALLGNLKAKVDELVAIVAQGGDVSVPLQALSDALGNNSKDLAAAVLANTPTPS